MNIKSMKQSGMKVFGEQQKSYFIIKLLNNYMIEKEEEYNPENHDIEVKYGENIKVYNGKMDYYYDHEKFLCLKNTENGQMYCLDKQQRKILYKIDKYEDMLKFLKPKNMKLKTLDGKYF